MADQAYPYWRRGGYGEKFRERLREEEEKRKRAAFESAMEGAPPPEKYRYQDLPATWGSPQSYRDFEADRLRRVAPPFRETEMESPIREVQPIREVPPFRETEMRLPVQPPIRRGERPDEIRLPYRTEPKPWESRKIIADARSEIVDLLSPKRPPQEYSQLTGIRPAETMESMGRIGVWGTAEAGPGMIEMMEAGGPYPRRELPPAPQMERERVYPPLYGEATAKEPEQETPASLTAPPAERPAPPPPAEEGRARTRVAGQAGEPGVPGWRRYSPFAEQDLGVTRKDIQKNQKLPIDHPDKVYPIEEIRGAEKTTRYWSPKLWDTTDTIEEAIAGQKRRKPTEQELLEFSLAKSYMEHVVPPQIAAGRGGGQAKIDIVEIPSRDEKTGEVIKTPYIFNRETQKLTPLMDQSGGSQALNSIVGDLVQDGKYTDAARKLAEFGGEGIAPEKTKALWKGVVDSLTKQQAERLAAEAKKLQEEQNKKQKKKMATTVEELGIGKAGMLLY